MEVNKWPRTKHVLIKNTLKVGQFVQWKTQVMNQTRYGWDYCEQGTKMVEALTESYYFHVVMLPQKTISIRSRKGRRLRWVSNECVEINAFGVYLVLTYKRLRGSSSWSYISVLLPLFISLILAVYRSLRKSRTVKNTFALVMISVLYAWSTPSRHHTRESRFEKL